MRNFHSRIARVIALTACVSVAQAAEATNYDQFRAWLEANRDTSGVELSAGDIAGTERLEALRPYLPPGYFEQLLFPDVVLRLQPAEHYSPHPVYAAATREHGGKATIGTDGRLENYVGGAPFSVEAIRAAPVAAAGYMVAWNHIHRWQYYGYRLDQLVLNYVKSGTGGKPVAPAEVFEGGGTSDRAVTMTYQRVYLNHLAMLPAQDFRMDVDDSERLYYKDYMDVLDPFDVAGTKFVIERALDPLEEDQVYSYLPASRRVRHLSAKERADSFMGSDYTFDDMEGFSGRVLDFDWEYLGETHLLHVSNATAPVSQFFGPMSTIPRDRWQVRRCFVVELTSHWSEHPYRRKVMLIDEETFNIALALIFNRDDVLWKTIATSYRLPDAGGGEQSLDASFPRWQATIAVDLVNERATIARTAIPTEVPEVTAAQVRRIFNVSSLTGGR